MMRLLGAHGADPNFVHEACYVATAGAFGFGAEARTEATTALMAAVGVGGPGRLSGFVEPDRSALDAASDPAVVELLSRRVPPR